MNFTAPELKRVIARSRLLSSLGAILLFLPCLACSSLQPTLEPRPPYAESSLPRHLFIFFDGTKNGPKSKTNILKLAQLVQDHPLPNTRTFYIEGVGESKNPLTGMLLGVGMEIRINKAYAFLAENYSQERGDKIYIFGFSRGAHQARDLAGIISYAGLPDQEKLDGRKVNKIIEIVKDEPNNGNWTTWRPGQEPPLARKVSGVKLRTADIAFLGVWDTVPGSFFKKYLGCEEVSTHRYKTNSYPPIHVIAHAMAIDEKRSRYTPLRVCDAIQPESTEVKQTWFPGAHSDVGGGYLDTEEENLSKKGTPLPLSSISLNWMVSHLTQVYPPLDPGLIPVPSSEDKDYPLAHWSIGDFPFWGFNHCKNREVKASDTLDKSVYARQTHSGNAPLKVRESTQEKRYPMGCGRWAFSAPIPVAPYPPPQAEAQP